jgi:proteasome lid subunit RPN8/RPN11
MRTRFDHWFKKTVTNASEIARGHGEPPSPRDEKNYANPVEDVHIWEYQPVNAESASIQIVTQTSVYDAICSQAHDALPNETGGFLMGQVGRDVARQRWHLYIESAVPVVPLQADPTHFTFTWRDVERVRTLRGKTGKALIGWYHTHPDFGVFLSRTDLEKTHNCLFNDEFQIALVFDPVRGTAAYFCRDGGIVNDLPHDEFHLEFRGDTP